MRQRIRNTRMRSTKISLALFATLCFQVGPTVAAARTPPVLKDVQTLEARWFVPAGSDDRVVMYALTLRQVHDPSTGRTTERFRAERFTCRVDDRDSVDCDSRWGKSRTIVGRPEEMHVSADLALAEMEAHTRFGPINASWSATDMKKLYVGDESCPSGTGVALGILQPTRAQATFWNRGLGPTDRKHDHSQIVRFFTASLC